MKYSFFIIVILSAILPFAALDAQTKVLKPSNIKSKITIKVSGNERDYYSLDSERENLLSVRGPGKLKIITRARWNSDKQKNVSYSLYYKVDGSEKIESKVKSLKKAVNATYKDKAMGLPADENTLVINLSEGEHNIQIWGGSKKVKVDARYLFTPSKQKKMKWVSLTPLNPNEPVNIISGEDVVNYFRFSQNKPLKINITGPTKIRVLTRVENHYNMKGRIFYRIKVNEDGLLKNSFQLNSVRSESTFYQNDASKVPGKAKEIVIDVPSGNHTYEIIPLDKDKITLLGKVLFPKKDVSLGD